MTTKPPPAPDPILAEFLEEAACVEVDLDLDAIERVVGDAIAPYEGKLTDKGLDRVRTLVAVAVLSGPDAERFRKGGEETPMTQAPSEGDASGTRPTKSAASLLDALRRRRGGSGGLGT